MNKSGAARTALVALTILMFVPHQAEAILGTTGLLEGRIRSKETREPLVGANVVVV